MHYVHCRSVPSGHRSPGLPDRTANVPFPSRPVSDVFRHFQADYPRPLTLSDTIGRKKSWSDAICLTSQVILTPKSSVIRTVPPFPTIIGRRRSCRQPHSPLGMRESSSPKAFRGNPLFDKSLLVLFVLFSYTYFVRSIFGRRQATPLFCPCRFSLTRQWFFLRKVLAFFRQKHRPRHNRWCKKDKPSCPMPHRRASRLG